MSLRDIDMVCHAITLLLICRYTLLPITAAGVTLLTLLAMGHVAAATLPLICYARQARDNAAIQRAALP